MQQHDNEPLISASQSLPEITLKAVVLAIIITTVLGAANVYLGLKLGMTIAASIPAAVVSMGVLRFFRQHNVLENNIIQTSASAGEGVAAAVAFILPALVIMGYWNYFHYWDTVLIVLTGGILGVFFSIPIRRVMLNQLNLKFPEGTAIGMVLKASASGTAKMRNLLSGGIVAAFIGLMQTGFQVFSDNIQFWFSNGKILEGIGLGFSPALLAAGYIIGIQACISLLVGVVTVWLIGMPLFSYHFGAASQSTPYETAMYLWSHHIRYVGVGTMLLGGLWTIVTLLKPISAGLRVSFNSLRTTISASHQTPVKLPRTERDIPFNYMAWGILILLSCGFFLLLHLFSKEIVLSEHLVLIATLVGTLFLLIGGFFLSSVCAYFSGLVGITNNPISGLMLSSIILLGLILLPFFAPAISAQGAAMAKTAASVVIIITALTATSIIICGENLQDLKAGQMVGATPWKQQVMLMLGVAVAAFIVAPILQLLLQAYGMGGVAPHAGMDPSQILPAPQAGLMSTIAQGVFGHNLPKLEIGIGIALAAICIAVDEYLKKRGQRLPVLGVGIGVYLPPEITLTLVVGGCLNYFSDKVLAKRAQGNMEVIKQNKENGTLLACGMVAGAALMGVILAIPFVLKGSSNALSLVSANFKPVADVLGLLATVFLIVWLWRTTVNIKGQSRDCKERSQK